MTFTINEQLGHVAISSPSSSCDYMYNETNSHQCTYVINCVVMFRAMNFDTEHV